MIGNEFSILKMSDEAELWIAKLIQSLKLKDYGQGTIKSYGN